MDFKIGQSLICNNPNMGDLFGNEYTIEGIDDEEEIIYFKSLVGTFWAGDFVTVREYASQLELTVEKQAKELEEFKRASNDYCHQCLKKFTVGDETCTLNSGVGVNNLKKFCSNPCKLKYKVETLGEKPRLTDEQQIELEEKMEHFKIMLDTELRDVRSRRGLSFKDIDNILGWSNGAEGVESAGVYGKIKFLIPYLYAMDCELIVAIDDREDILPLTEHARRINDSQVNEFEEMVKALKYIYKVSCNQLLQYPNRKPWIYAWNEVEKVLARIGELPKRTEACQHCDGTQSCPKCFGSTVVPPSEEVDKSEPPDGYEIQPHFAIHKDRFKWWNESTGVCYINFKTREEAIKAAWEYQEKDNE